jgi:hypothetical protein
VYQNYTFYKKKHVNDGVKWRCTHRGCISKLYLHECSKVIFRCKLIHNQEEPFNLPRKNISNSTKRKAAGQGIYKPLKNIREEIVNAPTELRQLLNSNDINRIRKNIYQEHRKNYPILTKSLNDTHDTINKLEIKTNIDEEFLLDNNFAYNIIIFSTKKNLKYICEKTIIFVDGTFSHCPKFFYQMFTLHTVYNNYYVPLIFALLSNKTIETYKICLK